MKYLIALCLSLTLTAVQAQQFEWNSKSPQVQAAPAPTPAYEQAYNGRQTGLASVYAATAQGTRTTSGEAYVNNQMTASHPVLPVGTIVRVQNLDNNRVVSVRINDQGKECSDCTLQLSQSAAGHLGIGYRGRVSIERTGFSNWNPAAPTSQAAAPAAYGNSAVTQSVQINRQWQSRGTQDSYQRVPAQQPAPAPATYGSDNYAKLSTPQQPSVMAREVEPAVVSRQPATYSRYPSTQQPRVYEPTTRPVYQPTTYQQQPSTYQQPAPQTPAPAAQAAPPPSTVARYQQGRTVPAPATYQTPAPAPRAYGGNTQLTARSVAVPTPAAAPAPAAEGYSVQLAAYSNEVYAKNRVAQLQGQGLENTFYRAVQKSDGQTINRVYAGQFATIAEAQQAARLIQGQYQIAGIVAALRN